MPHCIIEHSQDLLPGPLMQAVYTACLDSGLFEADDIKVRPIAYEHYQRGEYRRDFVHVTLKILSGRELEQRQRLSQRVLQALEGLGHSEISLTVEVEQIERESYAKALS